MCRVALAALHLQYIAWQAVTLHFTIMAYAQCYCCSAVSIPAVRAATSFSSGQCDVISMLEHMLLTAVHS